MKATDFFRALDDSDLDVYETRYLMRVWRRGTCWEKLQNIADTTGMSIGKASQVKKTLEEKGWIKQVVSDGRVAYQVFIPTVEVIQDVKPIVAEVHEVKSIVEEFHVVEQEFHHVKPNFHVVNALPINRPNEDHNIRGDAAADAISQLDRHFYQITLLHPPADPKAYIETWEEPLRTFLVHAEGDVETAKGLMTQAVQLARKPTWRPRPYPISNPRSVVNIATQHLASSSDESSAADENTIWQRAIDAITSGRPPADDPPLFHAIKSVGWTVIQAANKYNEKQLKTQLFTAYRSAPA